MGGKTAPSLSSPHRLFSGNLWSLVLCMSVTPLGQDGWIDGLRKLCRKQSKQVLTEVLTEVSASPPGSGNTKPRARPTSPFPPGDTSSSRAHRTRRPALVAFHLRRSLPHSPLRSPRPSSTQSSPPAFPTDPHALSSSPLDSFRLAILVPITFLISFWKNPLCYGYFVKGCCACE